MIEDANSSSSLTAADFREGSGDDDGAEIQSVSALDRSVVTFEPDSEGNEGSITLAGVTNASDVDIVIA